MRSKGSGRVFARWMLLVLVIVAAYFLFSKSRVPHDEAAEGPRLDFIGPTADGQRAVFKIRTRYPFQYRYRLRKIILRNATTGLVEHREFPDSRIRTVGDDQTFEIPPPANAACWMLLIDAYDREVLARELLASVTGSSTAHHVVRFSPAISNLAAQTIEGCFDRELRFDIDPTK
jgi:hypothetical protein